MSELELITNANLPADPPYWISAFQTQYAGLWQDGGDLGAIVNYSFQDSGFDVYGTSPLRAMTAAEKAAAVAAFAAISAVANLSFVESADAELQIGVSSATTAGLPYGVASTPNLTYTNNDLSTLHFVDGPSKVTFYDKFYSTASGLAQNSYIWLHEFLHSVGLQHSTSVHGNPDGIPLAEANGTTLFGYWYSVAGGYQDAPQLFDIAALQYLCGPNTSVRAGNDSYGIGLGAYNPAQPGLNQTLLWDGGGLDEINLSASARSMNVTLVAGIISRVGGATGGILDADTFAINYHTVIESLRTGSGNDRLTGNDVANSLHAGAGRDSLFGGLGDDSLAGGLGNDLIHGGAGTDTAVFLGTVAVIVDLSLTTSQNTGAGIDRLRSIENLISGDGDDSLTGSTGRNSLISGAGNDTLNAGDGNDYLSGGRGRDRLIGGDGKDVFVFDTAFSASNIDNLVDFNTTDDICWLKAAVFDGLALGRLSLTAFAANATGDAVDAGDRILFNTTSGNLYFDADGTGSALGVLFATLDPTTALSNADFVVF